MHDIGDIGEKWFAWFCTSEGIKVHPPQKDMNGWDFHLEHDPFTVFTKNSGLTKTYVQVKTTGVKEKTPKITLSALIKLVLTDLPCFVAHLTCEQNITSCRIYHVGPEIIDFALKEDADNVRWESRLTAVNFP